MSALKMQTTLTTIEREMSQLAPHRSFALFETFLINGYAAITLDSVPVFRRSDLLRAKLCLGTLITLYDDFADRPSQADAPLLDILYRLRFGRRTLRKLPESSRPDVVSFAHSLFSQIEEVLETLPHYQRYLDVLNFDLTQFYSANQFSSLLTAHPDLNNRLENQLYTHHNMGLIMVAMMDLMASEKIQDSELGPMREAFLIGQRMGRIFNVLATRRRELMDGDITGELSSFKTEQEVEVGIRHLKSELPYRRRQLTHLDSRITTFSVKAYLEGLRKVQALHERMEGLI